MANKDYVLVWKISSIYTKEENYYQKLSALCRQHNLNEQSVRNGLAKKIAPKKLIHHSVLIEQIVLNK